MATLQEILVSRLAVLTGNLEPTEQGSAKNHNLSREILAKALAGQQTEPLAISEMISGLVAADLVTAQPRYDMNCFLKKERWEFGTRWNKICRNNT
jgi:hypothetical protein